MGGMAKTRAGTLVMAFNKSDMVPDVGQTVVMHGSYGVSYAVTIHRIYSRRDTEHYTYLNVRATKRAIEPLEGETYCALCGELMVNDAEHGTGTCYDPDVPETRPMGNERCAVLYLWPEAD